MSVYHVFIVESAERFTNELKENLFKSVQHALLYMGLLMTSFMCHFYKPLTSKSSSLHTFYSFLA